MRVHVVGGGLAGLSAALALADAGRKVTLYEAGPACGGRCRSYDDRALGVRIDNGNHLLLSGNDDAFAFLRRIGSAGSLSGPGSPMFPFVDVGTGERWTLAPGLGRIPWWLASRRRRIPGTRLAEYGSLLRVATAGADRTVASCIGSGALAERLLAPLAIAILNTMPQDASAALLAAVFRESLMKGGAACVPCFPAQGLSESFVEPALAALAARGADVRTGWRVASVERTDGRVTGLAGPNGRVAVAAGDSVVLAVPSPVASALVADIEGPDRFESIINVHFRTEETGVVPTIGTARFVGLVGSPAEWVFLKEGVVSVTISAANRFAGDDLDALTARIWGDVVVALALPIGTAQPPSRTVWEKRATFEATPAQNRRRAISGARLASASNVTLAGDWTATGLPATIEGAIRSGRLAARSTLERA